MTTNWSRNRILFSLREAGTSAASLADEAGLSRFTFYGALQRPYPKVHALVAAALGVSRHTIWPQFYGPDDSRLNIIRRRAA